MPGIEWVVVAAVFWIFWSRGGRRWRRHGLEDAEVAALREAVVERDEQLQLMDSRLSELENRLDFTERLLSQRRTLDAAGSDYSSPESGEL